MAYTQELFLKFVSCQLLTTILHLNKGKTKFFFSKAHRRFCGGQLASAVQLSCFLLMFDQKSYGMFVLHSYVRHKAVADRRIVKAVIFSISSEVGVLPSLVHY